MADSAEGSGSNKLIYIGIGAVVLIATGVGVYFLMGKKGEESASIGAVASSTQPTPSATPTASGNDYVSGEAVSKRNSGNYNTWKDLGLAGSNRENDKKDPIKMDKWNQYDAYWGAIESNLGSVAKNEPLVSGFLKGMNLAQQKDYVAIFKPYIQQYIDNKANKNHWEVSIGEFLK